MSNLKEHLKERQNTMRKRITKWALGIAFALTLGIGLFAGSSTSAHIAPPAVASNPGGSGGGG
jgi:L-asparagine transporter-like permease